MDEDNNWDLLAVVRSCATTFPPSSARGTTISTTNLGTDPFPSFSSPTSKNSYHMHQCPDPLESSPTNTNHFKELQELYKPYTPSPLLPQPAVTQINPNTSSPAISVLGEFMEHKPQPVQTQPVLHRQFRHQKAHHVPSSPLSFRPSPPMFPRPIRRRKVQQKRMVSHVSAERLSADMWAWRKYGQKPIKGSPHPRNYYRCSSSKGCAARKQVERSPSDPNVFVVTYTGEHTHPRPTHRSSLSGSSRKFSGVPRLNSSEILNPADQSVVAKLSFPALNSPVPATSLSPTTPLTASMEYDTSSQNPNKVKDQPINEAEENPEKIMGVFSSDDNNDHDHNVDDEEDDGEDDYGLLIPNMVMSEDIFMGLQELGRATSSLAAGGKFPGTGGGR